MSLFAPTTWNRLNNKWMLIMISLNESTAALWLICDYLQYLNSRFTFFLCNVVEAGFCGDVIHLFSYFAYVEKCIKIQKSWALTQSSSLTCLPLRALDRLCCQQAVLDKLGQWHYQQVQSGWRWTGGAGESEEGLSQRHGSGRDGWVDLRDRRWGLARERGGITHLTS